MSKKKRTPEYTLNQAIALFEILIRSYYDHVLDGCEQCNDWDEVYCPEGRRLQRLHNKWIRRLQRLAVREGVSITLPSLL